MNLSETCQAGAYNTTDLQQLVTRLVGQEAATRFGSGYGLTGDMSITLASTVITPTSQQIATISVNAVSQWVYQVGKSQQQQISHQIAGKSKHDALFMLSHLDGIRGASVNLVGGYNDLLPQDADRIQIVVMYRFV